MIDLNEHMGDKKFQSHKLAGELANRYLDFHDSIISGCYVIYLDKAAFLTVKDIPINPALKKE